MREAALVVVAIAWCVACSGDDDGSAKPGAGSSEGPMIACGEEPINEGDATYYTFADGSGACGFPATPNDLLVGAMNAADYGVSAPCGACARVAGPDGEVTVRIVDLCPDCAKGQIDLSPQAFEKIAALDKGRVPISWQYVACDVSGPVTYHFKDGSNQWWTAIQMRNIRHAVSKLEFEKDGDFVAVDRLDYNYFVAESGMGEGPLKLRVTDVHGSALIDEGIALADNADRAGAAQFPACE
jgi:expansin (peptidoglycan-binding protein)